MIYHYIDNFPFVKKTVRDWTVLRDIKSDLLLFNYFFNCDFSIVAISPVAVTVSSDSNAVHFASCIVSQVILVHQPIFPPSTKQLLQPSNQFVQFAGIIGVVISSVVLILSQPANIIENISNQAKIMLFFFIKNKILIIKTHYMIRKLPKNVTSNYYLILPKGKIVLPYISFKTCAAQA